VPSVRSSLAEADSSAALVSQVAPLTEEERKLYEVIDVTVADFESAIGGKVTISEDKAEVLMGRMRYPSLSIHGIEGAFSAQGAKTVIPASVKGKFSIRLVPDQDPDRVNELVQKYLKEEFEKLGTKSTLKVEMLSGGKPWVASSQSLVRSSSSPVLRLDAKLTLSMLLPSRPLELPRCQEGDRNCLGKDSGLHSRRRYAYLALASCRALRDSPRIAFPKPRAGSIPSELRPFDQALGLQCL
jgi:hypothetical protein